MLTTENRERSFLEHFILKYFFPYKDSECSCFSPMLNTYYYYYFKKNEALMSLVLILKILT